MGINIDQVQHKVNSFNADRKARQDDFNKVRMDFSDKLKQFDADVAESINTFVSAIDNIPDDDLQTFIEKMLTDSKHTGYRPTLGFSFLVNLPQYEIYPKGPKTEHTIIRPYSLSAEIICNDQTFYVINLSKLPTFGFFFRSSYTNKVVKYETIKDIFEPYFEETELFMTRKNSSNYVLCVDPQKIANALINRLEEFGLKNIELGMNSTQPQYGFEQTGILVYLSCKNPLERPE